MGAIAQALADKDFLSAQPQDQMKYLASIDKDFAAAKPEEQGQYLNHILAPSRLKQSAQPTQFEKDRTQGVDRGYLAGLKESLPSVGSMARRVAFGGIDPVGDVDTIKNLVQHHSASDVGGALVGINPEKMRERAEHADTAGILGEATIPTVGATMGLEHATGSPVTGLATRGLTAIKPQLSTIADVATHPTTIPGRLMKAAVNQIPEKPTFPGASLPAADEFYKNRGEEINEIRTRTEASKPGPELGSPENPGFHSKLPTTMPKKIEPSAPTPELGSPENPGWHSKIPNTMPKTLPNVAPEQVGPPAQLPAGGSTQKLPTKFQKEVKPQILNFNDLANKVFNVKELDPKTPLNQQLENQPPKPLEVTDPMKAKYPDPGVRQMVRANGERMYEAAKHDPMLVKQIHDLTRVDLRQALVNAGEDMGQTTVSNSKFAGEGSIPREEAFNRLLDKGLSPEKIIELGKKTEGTANDRPQVKYKGGINEKGVEASTRQMSDKESISELENQIDTMNKTLKTSSRPAEEKAQLKQQISEYQARLDELRGTAKK
jgi:hypothetical protein